MMTSAMNPSQIGAKHVCADCAGKFYDLGKKQARCPKCGGKPVEQKLRSDGRPPRKARRSSFGPPRGPQGPAQNQAQARPHDREEPQEPGAEPAAETEEDES